MLIRSQSRLRLAAPSRRAVASACLASSLLFPPARALADGAKDCPGVDAVSDARSEAPVAEPKPSVPKIVGNALWNEIRRYGSDSAALVVAPFHWDVSDRWRAAGSAALLGGAFAADRAVYDAFARNRSDFTDGVSRATTWFGAGGGVAVAVGLLGAGLALGNTEVRDMGRDAVETTVIAGLLTNVVIKPTAGRFRPSESDGRTKFDPFSGHSSFTSGHTTQAFAVASVVAMRAPGWIIPTIAYGLATVVACDRINDRAHFASDVVAAALFTTATGRFIVNRHRPMSTHDAKTPKADFEILPIPDGIALRARW